MIYNLLGKMYDRLGFTGSIIAGVILFVVVIYTSWSIQRWFNYSMGYENNVRSTVCEMVKPEYLKNPGDC